MRPLTGLGRRRDAPAPDPDWDAQRLALYRAGPRPCCWRAGYEQVSMRMFRRAGRARPPDGRTTAARTTAWSAWAAAPARTPPALHYSFDYAVSVRRGARRSSTTTCAGRPADFGLAEFGFALDGAEQRRRWLVKSLLRAEGCDRPAYRARFGTDPADDFPQLAELAERGWLDRRRRRGCG